MTEETKPKTNFLPWIIVIILSLSLAIGTFFFLNLNSELAAAQSELTSKQSKLDILNSELAEKSGEADSLSLNLDEAQTSISDLEAAIASNEDDIETKDNEIAQLKIDKANLDNDLNLTEAKLENYLCEEQLTNMNYHDILTSSDRLAAFMSGLPSVDRTSYTFRNTVWNNAMSKIHGVVFYSKTDGNTYSMQFLVYYDELGWKKGTFWIDEQCWIDSPFD